MCVFLYIYMQNIWLAVVYLFLLLLLESLCALFSYVRYFNVFGYIMKHVYVYIYTHIEFSMYSLPCQL